MHGETINALPSLLVEKPSGCFSMKPIGSILSPLFTTLALGDKIALESLKIRWDTLFNEPLSIHIWPVAMEDGVLVIHVDSPAWLQQIKFYKQDVLEKLKAHHIKDVRFRHGSVYRNTSAKRPSDASRKYTRAENKELTPSERTWMEETLSSLQNEDVKQALRNTIEKSLGRLHTKKSQP